MTVTTTTASGPHAGRPVPHAGTPAVQAKAALVLVHGRGGDAADMLGLARHLGAEGFSLHAPEAAGNTWYPNRFIEPVERNEPWLGSALSVLDSVVAGIVTAGVPAERIALLGFSQGACLTLEYAVRRPRRFGALIGLSGGLIGAPGTVWPDRGGLEGTPVLLGCSDVDAHIPLKRVEETAAVLAERGAAVDKRIYPGFGHGINDDEVEAVRTLLDRLRAG